LAAPDTAELISIQRGLAQQPHVAGGQQYGLGVATESRTSEAEHQLPPFDVCMNTMNVCMNTMNVCMDMSATEAATNTLPMAVSSASSSLSHQQLQLADDDDDLHL